MEENQEAYLPYSSEAVKLTGNVGEQPIPNITKKKGGKPCHLTKEQRMELGARVSNMRLDGLSFRRIRQKLAEEGISLSLPAIIAIHDAYMTDFKKAHISNSDVQIGIYTARMERIINHALGAYAKTIPDDQEVGNVEILFKLAKLLDDYFDRLQSTGSIDKVKERVEHGGVVELQNFVKEFWHPKKRTASDAYSEKTPNPI